MRQRDHIVGDVVSILAPHLGDRVLVVLPDDRDPRFRVVLQGYEAWIWENTHEYTYEIVSQGTVLARGEAANVYAALERALPLVLLLNRSSSAPHAA